ncbi:MAG: DUF3492 domain-containing protein [Fodinibius sp.]|nr:DUF3492 domain-containing protein [Fodinibius sp.]
MAGISTWAHVLCSELEEDVDFILLALTGAPFVRIAVSTTTSDVADIIHVPLSGVQRTRLAISMRKRRSLIAFCGNHGAQGKAVEKDFMPMFRDFLDRLFDTSKPARESGELIYGFWKFFQHHDYKKTLSDPRIWTEFKRRLQRFLQQSERFTDAEEEPRMLDVTFGMRWLYHFMMPLAVSIPKVSATHATLAGFPAIASIAAKFEYGTPMVVTDHGVFIQGAID